MGTIQTVVSMVLSFASIKITSVYLGPAGIGTLGQLSYFMALSQAVIGAGIHTGIVRRASELRDRPDKREGVLSTAVRLMLVVGIPTAVVVVALSPWLAEHLLHDSQGVIALRVYGAVFVFGTLGLVMNASAAGAQDFRSLAWINVCTGVLAFALVGALSPIYGVAGGLFAIAVLPLLTWAVTWMWARRSGWWPKPLRLRTFSAEEARRLGAFVPLAIVTAVGMPLVQILIRERLIEHSGLESVGLLQGVMRISDMYLGVATGVFSMYFFPRFSEIRVASEFRRELRRGMIAVIPLVALVTAIIYFFRDFIVRIVFTPEFLPMRDLFGWQMTGNVFKMIGWLFGFALLAKVNAYAMAALEVVTIGLWWVLSVYFIDRNGAVGATQAYAVTYTLYVIATLVGIVAVNQRLPAVDELSRS